MKSMSSLKTEKRKTTIYHILPAKFRFQFPDKLPLNCF